MCLSCEATPLRAKHAHQIEKEAVAHSRSGRGRAHVLWVRPAALRNCGTVDVQEARAVFNIRACMAASRAGIRGTSPRAMPAKLQAIRRDLCFARR
jgi:hypothetical protein